MEGIKFQNIDSLKFMNLEGMTLDSLPKLSVPLPQDEEPPEVFCPLQSGKPLSSESKQIILNVFIGLRVMFPAETIEGAIKKTSKLTGCSVRTVYRIRKETKENSGKPPSPLRLMKTAKRKRKTRKELYSDFIVSGIRNIVQGFFQRNEVPTVKKIMQAINADNNYPNLSESTTSRLLKDIGLSHFLRSRDGALFKKGQNQQQPGQLPPPNPLPPQQHPQLQHHLQQQHSQQQQQHDQPQLIVQKGPNDLKCHQPGPNGVWCPPKTM